MKQTMDAANKKRIPVSALGKVVGIDIITKGVGSGNVTEDIGKIAKTLTADSIIETFYIKR
ncbi:hypothetical protein ATZ36_17895 [Candidatus Endomicrobiellum trichonymphae]|uniref:Uncharacterized protein n=1 Tax=Endomicrobium trichonymphae TaxID=1408204 RepID=A0A1E5IK20_ENDTX|nr:hypothetical protein ATZ36_17895 [Candidatus Endomicrobium trichonymphae]